MKVRQIFQFLAATLLYAVMAGVGAYLSDEHCHFGTTDIEIGGTGCDFVPFIPIVAAIFAGFVSGWRARWPGLVLSAVMPFAGAALAGVVLYHDAPPGIYYLVSGVMVTGCLPAFGAAAASAAFGRALICPQCGGKVAMTEDADGGDKGIAWSIGGKIFFWALAAICLCIGIYAWPVGVMLGLLMAAVYLVSLARHTAAFQCIACFAKTTFRAARRKAEEQGESNINPVTK
ncbi:MAG TPA: hypothetical protein VGM73_14900 [Candidatus Didemnitutus sp.]